MKLEIMCAERSMGLPGPKSAFTLIEVVMALTISAIAITGIIYGYIASAQRAEWTSYSLAAHSLAMQRVEQARAAKWDPLAYPAMDLLVSSNFPMVAEVLDIPISKTNIVYATNITTISMVSTSPPLKMIRVDCTWGMAGRGPFTNTIVTYRAQDQ